ncbi:histidine kinase [uncultured Microscilla sp.]|uniref:histidine kinase n=1 Tax=uncultured Microscilla sp. TaxID=432653 RepID=UPI002615716C|nr:sensor histidine kinase [uncultured Microscilla sp.]
MNYRFSYLSLGMFVAGVVIITLLSTLNQAPATYKATEVRFCYGDSLEWKNPTYSTAHWQRNFYDSSGVFWIRLVVNIAQKPQRFEPQGITVDFTGVYEVYWDGQLLGRNYNPRKTTRTVQYAPLHGLFLIPDSLGKAGRHEVALRVRYFKNYGKSPHLLESDYTDLNVGNYLALAQDNLISTAYVHIIAGVFLVIGLYYFFIFIVSNRHLRFLLFAIICMSFFALLIVEHLRFYYYYHFTFHYTRLVIIALLTLSISVLLPLFFMHRFPFKYKLRVIGAMLAMILPIWIFAQGIDPKTSYTMLVSFGVSLFLVLRAMQQRIEGSAEALLGIVVFFIAFVWLDNYDLKLFLGFGFLIIFMLLSLSIQMRKQRQEYEASLVHSSRLELEILKKNIQPHFLMNSLTSIIAWIDDDPAVGTRFIAALAEELEILIDVSSKKLIPLQREVELCESYLEVMSLRKEVNYTLYTVGVKPDDLIPPALIHTAIENGITHNHDKDGKMAFYLSFAQNRYQRHYTLMSVGVHRKTVAKKTGGTGLKYMEARLQESFPNRWQLLSKPIEGGWQTEFFIYNRETGVGSR